MPPFPLRSFPATFASNDAMNASSKGRNFAPANLRYLVALGLVGFEIDMGELKKGWKYILCDNSGDRPAVKFSVAGHHTSRSMLL